MDEKGLSMRFRNENTFFRANQKGISELVHTRYERALRRVEQTLGDEIYNYINGVWKRARERPFEDRFPGDLSILNHTFQSSSPTDVRLAISSAKSSFKFWRTVDYLDRCEIFDRAAAIMSKRKYELAAIVTLENGKNRFEAMADVDEAIDFLRYYSYQMKLNKGYSHEMPPAFPNERPRNLLRPFGVWGVVSPFNFPMAIMAGMSTGAMITGNTVVVKPASDAPWPAFVFASILEEAGLPPGVFNVVTGSGKRIGGEILRSPEVSGFVFTGSRSVGLSAMKIFHKKMPRPFIAEMGGKNAVIVTSKADLQEAVEGVGRAAFGYGGQKCSACSRALVERSIFSDFVRSLKDWTEGLIVGDPRERKTYLGPLINRAAVRKYVRCCRSARAAGKILFGGELLHPDGLEGYYVAPTIVTNLKKDHPLVVNELFLPFVCVIPINSFEQGIRIANSSEYGLTSGLMSHDESEIARYMDEIEAGTIYANRRTGASTAAMVGSQPFVGWKMSSTTWKAAGGMYYLPQFMREQSQTRCV